MRTLKNGQDGKLLLNALFHELLIHVSRTKTVHAVPLLDSMTSYIDQNKGSQVSLALLSDVFGVSESYIARLFKVNKGSTVSEYVNGVKIAAACDRLTADHTPIGKISDSLGFYNAYYFSRVFKKSSASHRHSSGETQERYCRLAKSEPVRCRAPAALG